MTDSTKEYAETMEYAKQRCTRPPAGTRRDVPKRRGVVAGRRTARLPLRKCFGKLFLHPPGYFICLLLWPITSTKHFLNCELDGSMTISLKKPSWQIVRITSRYITPLPT